MAQDCRIENATDGAFLLRSLGELDPCTQVLVLRTMSTRVPTEPSFASQQPDSDCQQPLDIFGPNANKAHICRYEETCGTVIICTSS